MADYVLSARITADVTGFTQGTQAVNRAAAQTNTAVNSLTTTVSRNMMAFNRVNMTQFNAAMRSGQISIRNLTAEANRVPAAVNNMNQALARSGNSARDQSVLYMNLGRVLQDLPFGFVGIQNNLTQLIPAAGLAGLAFSALVSAITFAQVGTGAWTRGLMTNKKAIDDNKKAMDEYADSLSGVAKARLEGTQNAQDELITLRTLYTIATDATNSIKQRKRAVDELQKQYPAYFKNLSDESIMLGKQVGWYERLAKVILATARAEAAKALIGENSKEVLNREAQMKDLQAQRAALVERVEKATRRGMEAQNALYTEAQKQWRTTGKDLDNRVKNVIENMGAVKDIDEQIFDLAAGRNKLNDTNLALTKEINLEVKKGADLTSYAGEQAVKKAKKILALFKGAKNMEISPDLGLRVQDTKGRNPVQKDGSVKIGLAGQAQINGAGDYLSSEQKRIIESQIKFNEDLESLIGTGMVSTISSLGGAIGQALAEGGNVFEAAGRGLLSSLGDILTQMGEAALKIGAGLIGIKLALKSLNPVVAIGAGVALVALGAFFKSRASGIGDKVGSTGSRTAFANGGVVYGPTNALVGEYSGAKNNPEVISPLNKLNDLISGSIKRSISSSINVPSFNRSMGSVGAMTGSAKEFVFVAESVTRGEDIVNVYKKTIDRLNRQ
jgi:hypothetical protein